MCVIVSAMKPRGLTLNVLDYSIHRLPASIYLRQPAIISGILAWGYRATSEGFVVIYARFPFWTRESWKSDVARKHT